MKIVKVKISGIGAKTQKPEEKIVEVLSMAEARKRAFTVFDYNHHISIDKFLPKDK